MKARITGRHGYADARDMYNFLGTRTLPDAGLPEREIQGVRVYVKPLVRVPGRRRNFNGLRVMAICNCGRHVPVGRLHQHRCPPGPEHRICRCGHALNAHDANGCALGASCLCTGFVRREQS